MRTLIADIKTKEGMRARLLHMMIFATMAVIIGLGAPHLYYKYIDNREYIRISFISFNKKVIEPCDVLTTTISYRSSISTQTKTVVYLYHIIDGTKIEEIKRIPPKDFLVSALFATDENIISKPAKFTETCELPEGTYFFKMFIQYQVKGYNHTLPVLTDKFTIERGDSQ